ncbi:MAG: hypothetical protein M3R02_01090 [Chloroflexota bacterium]|nr:hypothetical protein [Chloroflexota bacterium]
MATERARDRARALAAESLIRNDPLGWFQPLYAGADGDRAAIPWADLAPNPHLVDWFARTGRRGNGERALVVGCGLGDDAEELASQGFDVDALTSLRRPSPGAGDAFPGPWSDTTSPIS